MSNLVKKASFENLLSSIEEDGKIVAIRDPVFRDGSRDHFLRAHFFAPRKNIFGNQYSTFWVNLMVIWLMSLMMWLALYFDILRKALNFFSTLSEVLRIKKR